MSKKQGKLQRALEDERREFERKKKLEEERKKNIERIKLEARQQLLRVAIIDETEMTFNNLLKTVYKYKEEIREIEDCENCVNTEIPREVRSFMFKWLYNFVEHWNQQYNWWLNCDDRCLLTQVYRDDVRRVLVKKRREPTAKYYDAKLRELMKIYNSLCDVLRKKTISQRHIEDLITIRDELRKKLFDVLEVLTFEIVRHIDREMTSANALMARYSHIGQDFIKFVWSFKDVPLPGNYHKLKLINMDPLPMSVTMSNLIDLNSTVCEGLWFKYDFFSDFCPSFLIPAQIPSTDMDLEYKIRESMVEARLEKMKKEREEFEAKLEAKRLAEESGPKDKNKKPTKDEKPDKKKKKSKKKEESDPPIVDDSTYVDVEEEFVAYEDEIVREECELFSPNSLNLSEHEVNMREHQIINGVIKIECFERPLQTEEINPELFIRLDKRPNMFKRKNFHHTYQEPDIEAIKKQRKSVVGRSLSVKITEAYASALEDMVKVELKLSDKFFWFESPKVCRWEPWEESSDFAQLEPKVQDFHLNFEEYERRKREKLFSAPDPNRCRRKRQIADFDLTSAPENLNLSDFFKNYVIPMMPNEFKYFNEQLELFERKQHEWRDILNQKRELDEALDKESSDQINETFRETLKGFDINTVTIDDYRNIFDMRHFQPRNIFPQKYRNMIEVLSSAATDSRIKRLRQDFQVKQPPAKDIEDVDVGESRPFKNEPLALSELLLQIRKVQKSLTPFFRVIEDKRLLQVTQPELPKIEVEKFRKKSLKFKRSPRPSQRSLGNKSFRKRRITSQSITSQTASADDSLATTDSVSENPLQLIPHAKGQWSTRDIFRQFYDASTKTLTFYTGALGVFGTATRKYSNLPLKRWEMIPLTDEKDRQVLFKVEAQNVSIEFKVSQYGFTFMITHPRKPPFSGIDKPVKLRQLKQILVSLNINIFPEDDAGWYVSNICEKHKVMEFHTYKLMAFYCLSHHFTWSVWNRWAHRRVAVFNSRMIDKEKSQCLMVTPLRAASVIVRELCTDLDIVELDYTLDPEDQEFHPDIFYLLKAEVETKAFKKNMDNFMLIWFAQTLLASIRPLSFSQ